MKIDKLKCFISVARTLNFSQSAKELYLSQPSVSRIINSLEKEVGAVLLERCANNISLTKEGEVFLKYCKKVIAMSEDVIEDIRNIQMQQQKLTVGVLGFAENKLLSAISRLEAKYPELTLEMMPVDFLHPFEELETGTMDCFQYWQIQTPEGVVYLPLYEEGIKAYINKNHPLAQKDLLTIEDIASLPNIIFNFTEGQDDPNYRHIFPKPYCNQVTIIKVKDTMSSRRLLELNRGIILSPDGGILIESPEIKEMKIEANKPIYMGLCYKEANTNPALHELINYLKDE